jgi:hypothetical protein
MKHLQRMLILTISLLSFYSCQKEEDIIFNPESLTADVITKAPKNPYKGTRIKEIRSWYRSYVISYNKHGDIDSINAQDYYPGTSMYKYIAYYTKSKLDSIQLINNGRVESVVTNILYKGTLIVQSEYWYQPTQPYPFVRPLHYDNKKRLLNTTSQDKLIYDETGAIIESNNPNYPVFSYNFTVDYNINPLHLVPNFFLILIEDYNIAEFWYNPFNTTSRIRKDGNYSVFYQNEYNNKGQLVKKTWTEYGYPQYLIYIYE